MPTSKTLEQLAEAARGTIVRGDPERRLARVMPTATAEADAITFVAKADYLEHLSSSRAGAVILSEEFWARVQDNLPSDVAVIMTANPYAAYARVAQELAPPVPGPEGIDDRSVIDESAELGDGVRVGPFVVIGARTRVGAGTVLHAGVHLGEDVVIGSGSRLFDHVVVRPGCTVGRGVIVHAGVVIGADGFGFAQDRDPETGELEHVKIPQRGTVVIEDGAELGANVCVDRGALGTTRIGKNVKIDNLVQIGHNVQIGDGSILVAQSGVAGSSKLGKEVILAAQAGIAGHLTIGDGVRVLGQAGVIKDVPDGQSIAGTPAVPEKNFFRTWLHASKLDSLVKRVKKLERLMSDSERDS